MSKVTELHPEPLLERGRRGGLEPEGWQQVGAHLARCRTCAWEQAAIEDFARERGGGELDAARMDRLVEGALARVVPMVQEPGVRGARRGPVFDRSLGVMARCLAAAAVVAVAIGAALVLPGRGGHEGANPAVPSEASLDAGATGVDLGRDS